VLGKPTSPHFKLRVTLAVQDVRATARMWVRRAFSSLARRIPDDERSEEELVLCVRRWFFPGLWDNRPSQGWRG